jgi:hypothetical protein
VIRLIKGCRCFSLNEPFIVAVGKRVEGLQKASLAVADSFNKIIVHVTSLGTQLPDPASRRSAVAQGNALSPASHRSYLSFHHPWKKDN